MDTACASAETTEALTRCCRPACARKKQVTHIYHTHGHFDHILASGKLKAAFPAAKLCLHKDDEVGSGTHGHGARPAIALTPL